MKRLILSAVLMLSAFSFSAQAGLELSPLVSVFKPGQDKGVLSMINTDTKPKTYQVFVEKWVVVDGKQLRQSTNEIRFAPSLITIPAGKRQVVRYLHNSNGAGEQAYRIRVQEILDPEIEKLPGLHHTISIDFPWIWRAADAKPSLAAHWEGGTLVIKNSGTATARLTKLTAGNINKDGLVGYVLPGEVARFELGAQNAPSSVSVESNGKAQVLVVQ